MLLDAGFVELAETDAWRPLVKPGGGYFFVRGGSLVAFFVGGAFEAGNGFNIVGAHTDSPVIKLKPCSKKSAHGCIQINVETYGGGLWHTWFDRELSLAGSVIVKEDDGTFVKKLIHIQRPLLRIPNLCIHLTSADERGKFAPNKETHLQPILGLVNEAVNKPSAETPSATNGSAGAVDVGDGPPLDDRHAPELLHVLAAELDCTPSAIMDFELTLCDTQPSSIWGLRSELLSAPRLDNQISCFTALRALIAQKADAPTSAPDVCMVACFDHEEVGSDSSTGAGGPVMAESMQRVSSCFSPDEPHAAAERLLVSTRRSFLMSADTAHAVHPNYAERHQSNHAPKLNQGTVIKTNDNQRYATNGDTGFVVRELARRAGIGIQEFMVKNDCPCGSTIGPIISSNTGLRTVDLGVGCWSMHSIRETIGVADVDNSFVLFRTFFAAFAELDKKCVFGPPKVCPPCKPKSS